MALDIHTHLPYIVIVIKAMSQPKRTTTMKITIKSNPALTTQAAVQSYINDLITETPALAKYRGALVDVVNTQHDDVVVLHSETDMRDDGHLDAANGVHCLWMPEIGRAALNSFQAGDWQWTDARSAEDAVRRYREDDMSP
jgi:hypothetical protein